MLLEFSSCQQENEDSCSTTEGNSCLSIQEKDNLFESLKKAPKQEVDAVLKNEAPRAQVIKAKVSRSIQSTLEIF